VDAGPFAAWLDDLGAALRGEGEMRVPCGGCTACCAASQFVEIAPDEADALAHIPRALLFPAPQRPGHVVLGYDEQGRCPMLGARGCTIYEHRPRACRVYDCRVFAATGVEPDDVEVAERARQWRFSLATPEDRGALAAMRSAASSQEDGALGATARAVRIIRTATGTQSM
jgi:Fe-S-cluster containining protein